MHNKTLIFYSTLVIFLCTCTGCATYAVKELSGEEIIPTKFVGLYFDDNFLYVRYKAEISNTKSYEKIGKFKKTLFWDCSQHPGIDSKIPHTVQHNGISYSILFYNPFAKKKEGDKCKTNSSISDIKDVDFKPLSKLPIKEVTSIHKDDPVFSAEPKDFYAFSVTKKNLGPQEDIKIWKIDLLLVERNLNKILLIQGLNLPEEYVRYLGETGKIVSAVGSVPAAAFDIVTLPVQAYLLHYLISKEN